ncbi:hypothetical protein ABTW96_23845 [Nocardia beijingensis]|uniref:hypothetical protein n=1 Tax=Nocardia beijingensis TaxID=95162 RepID=UPI003331B56A
MSRVTSLAAVMVRVLVTGLRLPCCGRKEWCCRISRPVDIPDLPLPEWQQVLDREYQPWDRDHIILDTAGERPDQSLCRLLGRLHHLGASSVLTSGSNGHEEFRMTMCSALQ